MDITLPAISFFLMTFLIGIHSSRRIYGKVRNYFVAGNIVPFWVISLSLTGQAIEFGATRGNALRVLQDGFWFGAVLPLGIGVALLLLGFFYAKPLHAMKLLTLPDFFRKRYNRVIELLTSILTVLGFIILLGANLAGLGLILNFATGVSIETVIIMGAAIIMIYVMAGGLFAVTWNDILHVGVIIIALGAAITWLVSTTGVDFIVRQLGKNFNWADLYRFDGGALSIWAKFLALALGDILALDFMERVFASKTSRKAAQSCLIAGVITILVGMLCVLISVAIKPYMASLGDNAYPFLSIVKQVFPQGIAMMMFIALIGACVSTADGAIMACSTVITRNIIQPFFKLSFTHKRLLFLSRLAAVPVAVLGIAAALVKPEPGNLLVLAFDLVLAGCFVPLTLGLFWRRANSRAAFWAIAAPTLLRAVLYVVLPPRLAGLGTLIPPVLSLIIYVGVTLASGDKKQGVQ